MHSEMFLRLWTRAPRIAMYSCTGNSIINVALNPSGFRFGAMLHHRQMLRGLILLILFLGLAVLALPFLLSSMYVDQRGVTIPGRVSAKREDVTVYYATVKRSCEVT